MYHAWSTHARRTHMHAHTHTHTHACEIDTSANVLHKHVGGGGDGASCANVQNVKSSKSRLDMHHDLHNYELQSAGTHSIRFSVKTKIQGNFKYQYTAHAYPIYTYVMTHAVHACAYMHAHACKSQMQGKNRISTVNACNWSNSF